MSLFLAPQTLQTRWLATSGTGIRFGRSRLHLIAINSSIEGVKLELDTSVRLLRKNMGGQAFEGRRLTLRVLAFGRPFGRADQEIALAGDLNDVERVVGRATGKKTGKEFLNGSRPLNHVMAGWKN